MKRRKKVTSVDKANVLDSSRLVEKSCRRSGKGLSGSDTGTYAGGQLCNAACQEIRHSLM